MLKKKKKVTPASYSEKEVFAALLHAIILFPPYSFVTFFYNVV